MCVAEGIEALCLLPTTLLCVQLLASNADAADQAAWEAADQAAWEAMQRRVRSIRLRSADMMDERDKLEALALYVKHLDVAGLSPSAVTQWERGLQLAGSMLQSDSLEQEVCALVKPVTAAGGGDTEHSSRWLGKASGGEIIHMKLKDGLKLYCVTPSSAHSARGAYGISHMQGATDQPIMPNCFGYGERFPVFCRFAVAALPVYRFIYTPVAVFTPHHRDLASAIWSSLVLCERSNLEDVTQVEVVHGVTKVNNPYGIFGPGREMVLQIVFTKSDKSQIKMPDCDPSSLFRLAHRQTEVFPPQGATGKVTAISGQGNALKVHWKLDAKKQDVQDADAQKQDAKKKVEK